MTRTPTNLSTDVGLEGIVPMLLGAINEARVHLSDLTEAGLRSVDSADEILGEALRTALGTVVK
jgi:hypothetical protein